MTSRAGSPPSLEGARDGVTRVLVRLALGVAQMAVAALALVLLAGEGLTRRVLVVAAAATGLTAVSRIVFRRAQPRALAAQHADPAAGSAGTGAASAP